MTIRCALIIDDSSDIVEVDFLRVPRVGEYIQLDGEPQDIRIIRILHQVHTGTGQAAITVDATTAIL